MNLTLDYYHIRIDDRIRLIEYQELVNFDNAKTQRAIEAMMEELADNDLYRKAAARLADKSRAVEVSLDQL